MEAVQNKDKSSLKLKFVASYSQLISESVSKTLFITMFDSLTYLMNFLGYLHSSFSQPLALNLL